MLFRTEEFKNPHFSHKDRDSAVKKNNERAESLSAFGGSLQNMRIFVTVTRNEAPIGAACEHQPCGIANAYSYV